MEADRKKQLLKAWRQQETANLVASIPMPHADLRDLFDLLDRENAPPCDHSLQETIQFLRQRNLDVDRIVSWLNSHGGYCDCEVIFNVEEKFGEMVGRTHQ